MNPFGTFRLLHDLNYAGQVVVPGTDPSIPIAFLPTILEGFVMRGFVYSCKGSIGLMTRRNNAVININYKGSFP